MEQSRIAQAVEAEDAMVLAGAKVAGLEARVGEQVPFVVFGRSDAFAWIPLLGFLTIPLCFCVANLAFLPLLSRFSFSTAPGGNDS